MDYTLIHGRSQLTYPARNLQGSMQEEVHTGAVNAAAWLRYSRRPYLMWANKPFLDGNRHRERSPGARPMGSNGREILDLAIYYPTDQLVPIINLTAQGSAYGSTSAGNLVTR